MENKNNKPELMTVHFKNGKEIKILQETAEIIKKNLLKGAEDLQIFSDQNGKMFLMVRLSEIFLID